ncbi:hypothetical protein WBJ53_31145 [Spirosoma sp. SC4-14]|uniref:hypothetical protein n=1 Tax=Spirosoma sp. SC4-14 TaxID=3128900 RepID=UPI0030D4D335
MMKQLLFFVFLGMLTACRHESDILPNATSLAGEVVGTYQTNFFLDPSCAAIPSDKMPFAKVEAESDSAVTLIYTRQYPNRETRRLEHIKLNRQADAVQFNMADSSIGLLQTDRMFMDNGMEKQGKVLRLTMQNSPEAVLFFTGYKQ